MMPADFDRSAPGVKLVGGSRGYLGLTQYSRPAGRSNRRRSAGAPAARRAAVGGLK